MASRLTRLSDIAQCSADQFPDRIALQDLSDDPGVSYAELWSRVEQGAAALRRRGLAAGDRVLLVMDAGVDWLPAFLAIVHADLVAIPVPSATTAQKVGLVAFHAEVRAVVLGTSTMELAETLTEIPCLTATDLLRGRGLTAPPPSGTGDSTAVLVFTSGSTARPRAVELTHENLLANLRSLVAVRHAGEGEAMLSVLPPAHLYELLAGQLAPIAIGARVVYGGAPLPNRLVDALRTRAITRTALVPALLDAMGQDVLGGLIDQGLVDPIWRGRSASDLAAGLESASEAMLLRLRTAVRERLSASFRTIAVGGAAVSPAWFSILETFGIGVDVGYGLTEAGPLVSMGAAAECPRGSVGRPLPGVEVRVDAGGEILVRSESVMVGYFKDPDATARTLEGGWLRTGDRGRLDGDGFLFIAGRIKEAIVTGAGETIYPDEVEPSYASPLFAEHAVVPSRAADGNDIATLVVVPAADVSSTDVQQAFAALRAAAPARHRVTVLVVRDEPLPRTAVGKIRRRVLADALQPHEVLS